MDRDKTKGDNPAVADEKGKTPPRDRDQAPYSPARAQDKADHAEFSDTAGAQEKPDSDDLLITRDNLKKTPPRPGSS